MYVIRCCTKKKKNISQFNNSHSSPHTVWAQKQITSSQEPFPGRNSTLVNFMLSLNLKVSWSVHPYSTNADEAGDPHDSWVLNYHWFPQSCLTKLQSLLTRDGVSVMMGIWFLRTADSSGWDTGETNRVTEWCQYDRPLLDSEDFK